MKPIPLSILMLSYNHEPYVHQCIHSLANQTRRDFEVVYLDNCSSDQTSSKALALLENSGLQYTAVTTTAPSSIGHNLNRCFLAASGRYLVPLSIDDWLDASYVEKTVDYFESSSCKALLHFAYVFHQQSGELGLLQSTIPQQADIIDYSGWTLGDEPPCTQGWCIAREAVERVGGWDPALLIEDTDMFFRVAQHYQLHRFPERLFFYRRQAQQVSRNYDFMTRGIIQFCEKHAQEQGWSRSFLTKYYAEMYRTFAAMALDGLDFGQARGYLCRSFCAYPFKISSVRTIFYFLRSWLNCRTGRLNEKQKAW